MTERRLACLALTAALAATVVPASPALADGAASTRNIIFGGAAVSGTLLIVNHNRQVHAREAAAAQQQANTQAAADNAEQAYESERAAYNHEAALVASDEHEIALQHSVVLGLRAQLAQRVGSGRTVAANTASTTPGDWGPAPKPLVAAARTTNTNPDAVPSGTSYGWGRL